MKSPLGSGVVPRDDTARLISDLNRHFSDAVAGQDERALISWAVHSESREVVLEVLEIPPEDFTDEAARAGRLAVERAFKQQGSVDPFSFRDALAKGGELAHFQPLLGEAELLTQAQFRACLKRVGDNGWRRNLLRELRLCASLATEPDSTVEQVQADVAVRLANVLQRQRTDTEPVRLDAAVKEFAEKLLSGELAQGLIRTGQPDLDRFLGGYSEIGGFGEGQLIILAARPAMGKSALAWQWAQSIAESAGPVLCFSMEMARLELAARAVAQMRQVAPKKIAEADLERALEQCEGLPLFVHDYGVSLEQLESQVRAFRVRHGKPAAVFVDYVGLLRMENARRNASTVDLVSEITRRLKNLAMGERNVVVALSQLSRKCEERADKRPVLSDLRESGSLEQDANKVIFIYRDGYYNGRPEDRAAEILIAKNREGPTGVVRFVFNKETTTFFCEAEGEAPDWVLRNRTAPVVDLRSQPYDPLEAGLSMDEVPF